MHYQPSVQNLFSIVLQLSRFFKELVDFESTNLPQFRHPLIRNRLLTLQKKTDSKVVGDQSMTQQTTIRGSSTIEDQEAEEMNRKMNLICLDEFSVDSVDPERLEHHKGKCKNHLEDIGLLREVKRMDLYDNGGKTDIISGYERANVDVPAGLQQYLEVFREQISQAANKKNLRSAKAESEMDAQAVEDVGIFALNIEEFVKKIAASPSTGTSNDPVSKKVIQAAESKITAIKPLKDRTGEKPRMYYFYKRWIWIMFPWACMSIQQNSIFSDQIKRCFSSDLKYIKVIDELEIT